MHAKVIAMIASHLLVLGLEGLWKGLRILMVFSAENIRQLELSLESS